MSQAHRDHVRRIVTELFNTSDSHRAAEFYTETCLFHDPAYPPAQGADSLAAMLTSQRAAMPDLTYTIEDLFTDGADKAVLRWSASGTHGGEVMGVASTGRRVSVTGTSIFRFEAGRVAEVWQHWDLAGFHRQVSAPNA